MDTHKIEARKVRKTGNSYVVTLPPSILAELNLVEGDEVNFIKDGKKININKREDTSLDEDFLKLVDDIYQEHKETFEMLADR
jgi:putative addiction module antidote